MQTAVVSYRERLVPGPWAFVVAAALIAMLTIAYGAVFGSAFGWIGFVGLYGLCVWAMVGWAPVIEVHDGRLRAGTAVIDLSLLGAATALDSAQSKAARGIESDALRYTVLRTWATRTSVLVPVMDPADPHPAWLMSSRHPDDLVQALSA